jgi:hypothetical protein
VHNTPDGLVKRGSATFFRRTKGAWTERATLVAADSAAGACTVRLVAAALGAPPPCGTAVSEEPVLSMEATRLS